VLSQPAPLKHIVVTILAAAIKAELGLLKIVLHIMATIAVCIILIVIKLNKHLSMQLNKKKQNSVSKGDKHENK